MSESLIEESIISRPTYGALKIVPGLAHYFLADASGAECVIRVVQEFVCALEPCLERTGDRALMASPLATAKGAPLAENLRFSP